MKDNCKKECKIIEENCVYTAETHHIIANNKKILSYFFQLAPAIIASILGSIVLIESSSLFSFLTVVSAVISAVANMLNPLKEYQDHLNSAKNFTLIKHDARLLCRVLSERLSEEEFLIRVENLHNRYKDLVRVSPPTNNRSFEKARKRVRAGMHKPDDE